MELSPPGVRSESRLEGRWNSGAFMRLKINPTGSWKCTSSRCGIEIRRDPGPWGQSCREPREGISGDAFRGFPGLQRHPSRLQHEAVKPSPPLLCQVCGSCLQLPGHMSTETLMLSSSNFRLSGQIKCCVAVCRSVPCTGSRTPRLTPHPLCASCVGCSTRSFDPARNNSHIDTEISRGAVR